MSTFATMYLDTAHDDATHSYVIGGGRNDGADEGLVSHVESRVTIGTGEMVFDALHRVTPALALQA